MKISLNWVKEFTSVDLPTDELVRKIGTQLGAVESVEDWGGYYDDQVVVAEIVEAKDHPDADKLGVYQVSNGNESFQVLAGDKTLKVGDKVGYIQPGGRVPISIKESDPFTIEAREMRGLVSNGMLGSGAELLINNNNAGVQVLDSGLKVGAMLRTELKLDDVIIDVENKMFTHRPDLFGMLGLAREIAGITGQNFSSPDWYVAPSDGLADNQHSGTIKFSVNKPSTDFVSQLSFLSYDNIVISDSSLSRQSLLFRLGVKPINNIVDITNYVAQFTAQPTHAYDYDKLCSVTKSDNPTMSARLSVKGDKIDLLDGTELTLDDGAMLITANDLPVGLAGVMGGASTQVDKNTTRVLIEIGSFNLYEIRRTSMKYGIFTDAVTRFGKGQSVSQITPISVLINKIVSSENENTTTSSIIEAVEYSYSYNTVAVEIDYINNRLGSSFKAEQIVELLGRVEMKTTVNNEQIMCTIPFWRTDLEIPEDIIEELGRLFGYDNLNIQVPPVRGNTVNDDKVFARNKFLRTTLAAAGATELLTYSFVSKDLYETAGIDSSNNVEIRNALSPALQIYRSNLTMSLLQNVHSNHKKRYSEFLLFELNVVLNSLEKDDEELPVETDVLAAVYSSISDSSQAPYYLAKRYVEMLINAAGLKGSYVQLDSIAESSVWIDQLKVIYHGKRSAALTIDGKVIGVVGEYASQLAKALKLEKNSAGFELQATIFDGLVKHSYGKMHNLPSVVQDITIEVTNKTTFESVESEFEASLKKLLADDAIAKHRCVSIFEKEAVKSISFRVEVQPLQTTMSSAKVQGLLQQAAADIS